MSTIVLIKCYIAAYCLFAVFTFGFLSIRPRPTPLSSIGHYLSLDSGHETSLGAPGTRPLNGDYISDGGIQISTNVVNVANIASEMDNLVKLLDDHKGVLLTSSYEFPGRYARWSIGFVSPALQIEGTGGSFSITALNSRGVIIREMIRKHLASQPELFLISASVEVLSGSVITSSQYFPEEERSKQPSLFSLVRAIRELFSSSSSGELGLYGSFGYDLTFQFEPIELKSARSSTQRDLVLFLPDELLVVDNQKNDAWKVSYEFTDTQTQTTTRGLAREMSVAKFEPAPATASFDRRDSVKGDFAKSVVRAKEEFRVGNLFEVVLSQTFRERVVDKPSTIFNRLCRRNPSPYGFFMNLGSGEYLVGASPEMFVRVDSTPRGLRVETCPISGTIERGDSPLEDAQQIKKLLLSAKEESELTMCTDVDRNDKSRICIPGSVRVLGRRQIEMYSRLIHTVDHVEGVLRPGYDALDAFLCHTWAVTVTGAPKTWAIRFIEQMEKGPRRWYGGAVGVVGFDGTLNTGLTLRTMRIDNGIAEVRAGATLLHDSVAEAEEAETELKASALLDAIVRKDNDADDSDNAATAGSGVIDEKRGVGARVLLVDHEDSFVHTLANYIRQTGAEVVTCRSGDNLKRFLQEQVDTGLFSPTLAVLSPGPGSPSDFKLSWTIDEMRARKVPIFGVCLGLQGLVEYFGGELGVLSYPMHGKPSVITRCTSPTPTPTDSSTDTVTDMNILEGLPAEFSVARYHSLHGLRSSMPAELEVIAQAGDVVMAIQHRSLPIAAVQFHPESILTLPKHGMRIIANTIGIWDHLPEVILKTRGSGKIQEQLIAGANETLSSHPLNNEYRDDQDKLSGGNNLDQEKLN
eukprot:gene2402-4659_t